MSVLRAPHAAEIMGNSVPTGLSLLAKATPASPRYSSWRSPGQCRSLSCGTAPNPRLDGFYCKAKAVIVFWPDAQSPNNLGEPVGTKTVPPSTQTDAVIGPGVSDFHTSSPLSAL